MGTHPDRRLDSLQAKGHAARFAPGDLRGETGRNVRALSDGTRRMGAAYQRAGEIAGLKPKEIAARLNVHESGISRLYQGDGTWPLVVAWDNDPILSPALIEALARRPGDAIVTKTVIEIATTDRAVNS